ncbi:MAG: hypothetical protein ACLGHM_02620 [Actinomycetes bacterium]
MVAALDAQRRGGQRAGSLDLAHHALAALPPERGDGGNREDRDHDEDSDEHEGPL